MIVTELDLTIMSNIYMNEEKANLIYTILVDHAGANESWRDDFVHHMILGTLEYRFQGKLGFGGKLYLDPLRVNCYSEDRNSEREQIIKEVNCLLNSMKKLDELIFDFVNEMLCNGTESPKLDSMIEDNLDNDEFVRLAELARKLKHSSI